MTNEGQDFALESAIQQIFDEFSEKFASLKMLNVLIVGKTGVGKSTLINALFRGNLASTGSGKPVTQGIKKITKQGVPLTIYDTPGFELADEARKRVNDQICGLIQKRVASGDFSEAIHCVLYCISAASHRVESEELEWIRNFSNNKTVESVPIIVVLTQSYMEDSDELCKIIEKENLNICGVVPVLAAPVSFMGGSFNVPAYGLKRLTAVMMDVLPKSLAETFQNVQIADLEAKKRSAMDAVKYACVTAAGVAAAPLPFSDFFALVPVQITMIASITVIFGVDINKGIISSIVYSMLGTLGATFMGRSVVTNLLKLIPGVGSVAGVVSAGTAATITAALGGAYIAIMEKIFTGEIKASELDSEQGRAKMKTIFQEELKKK